MDRQPVLEGKRLLLRPLEPGDWDALYAVACDPLIWEVHPAGDRWQEDVFRAYFADALDKRGALVVIDKYSGSVEIGWTFLARSHWGGEINREMKRLMLSHALSYVERVMFRVGETNWRSRRAMEKIGGRLSEAREYVQMDGREVAQVVYEITRESFAAGPLSPSGSASA
jgi:RimJ/RimL family protein N-acetyltransferase